MPTISLEAQPLQDAMVVLTRLMARERSLALGLKCGHSICPIVRHIADVLRLYELPSEREGRLLAIRSLSASREQRYWSIARLE